MHSYVAEARDNIRCDPLFGITWRKNVSGTSCKLLDEDATTYQEQPARYLKKSFQRIRNVLQLTWRRCSNVSGTSGKLLEEDVTTYQEHLASYLKKMLQGGSGPSRCVSARGPVEPVRARTEPVEPVEPIGPVGPVEPVGARRALNGHKARLSYSISDTHCGSFQPTYIWKIYLRLYLAFFWHIFCSRSCSISDMHSGPF